MSFSISVTVNTSELEAIIQRCGSYPSEVGNDIGNKILTESKILCPVDTSNLVNSAKLDFPGGKVLARISYEPKYGLYQELGFHHWRSGKFIQNSFLLPAVDHFAKDFLAPGTWTPIFLGGKGGIGGVTYERS